MDEVTLRRIISEEIARANEAQEERLRRYISEEIARASFAASQGAAASASGTSRSGDDVEDLEELQQLISEMTKLNIGLRSTCKKFALSLAQQGIMSLNDLPGGKDFTHQAVEILRKAGMQDVQAGKVIDEYVQVRTDFSLFD